MCVTITPAAATFMKRMTLMSGGKDGAGFRLSVKEGGCSGFASEFTIAEAPLDGDMLIEAHGARLFLPAKSCELLRGYQVDFVDSPIDSGLKFSKPGAQGHCGCASGEPKNKAGVVFMRAGSNCLKG